MTTKAAVEATAITGGGDTKAATTAMTAMMVTVTTMTRLNVCDASMEEKEHLNNQIDKRARAERVGRR